MNCSDGNQGGGSAEPEKPQQKSEHSGGDKAGSSVMDEGEASLPATVIMSRDILIIDEQNKIKC